MEWLVARYFKLQVHTDVNDDANRPEGLPGEHSEIVVGVVQVAELSHQTLGVQRPSLGVSGRSSEEPLEARKPVGEIDCRAKLEVVSGYTLVVGDGDLSPERKSSLAACRIPGATGAGEVL